MNTTSFKGVYFVGIGGIGMSALAKWLLSNGYQVAGYDKTETPLTQQLEKLGMQIHYEDNINLSPSWSKLVSETLVIYTPAIPKNHTELNFFIDNNYKIMKRSELLGMISKDYFTIAIGGTHGKTSSTALLTHLLNGTDKGCLAFVGGIMKNYNSNFINGQRNSWLVVEADEYDRSFLRLEHNYAAVTSVDPDHLDIYGDHSQMQKSYLKFIQNTATDGKIFLHKDVADKIGHKIDREYNIYGNNISNIRYNNGSVIFDFNGVKSIKNIEMFLQGNHNLLNASLVINIALSLGIDIDIILQQLKSFRGVKRRFDYQIKNKDFVFIDDYAHHPSEIEAFLSAVKTIFNDKKITVVFQPHLFTRTRDFQEGFATSLSLADEVILLDIYPARELPIEGVTSDIIFNKLKCKRKFMFKKEQFPEVLDNFKPEILVTVGAGDIDTLVPKINNYYLNKYGYEQVK